MRIAVDFDGTIVENCFPEIGEERPFAVDVLKKCQVMWAILLISEAVLLSSMSVQDVLSQQVQRAGKAHCR